MCPLLGMKRKIRCPPPHCCGTHSIFKEANKKLREKWFKNDIALYPKEWKSG
jgi:hypothetical protein